MKHRDTVTEFNNFKARLSSNQDIHRLQTPKRNSSASSDRSDQSNGTPNRDTKNKRLSVLLNQIPSKPIKHKRLDNSKQLNQIYDIEEQPIGKGSYGIVYRAIDAKDRKPWAIKKIVKDSAGTTGVRLLEREVSILKRVTHKNIIHLEAVYETHDTMFLVTELCVEGELKDYLKKQENNVLAEPAARDIVRQLAEALFYLHKHGVVHRDIKLENVLVTRNTDVSPKVSRRVSLASGMPTLRSSVYDRRQSLPPVGQSKGMQRWKLLSNSTINFVYRRTEEYFRQIFDL